MKDILNRFTVKKHDAISISIHGSGFDFMYTQTNRDDGSWIGGLQCNFEQGSKEFKELEGKLMEVAEYILSAKV